MSKLEPERVATQVKGMQRDLKNLEKALGELVDAMISEEKPGPKEIKKLTELKKEAKNLSTKSGKIEKTKKKSKKA